MTADLSAVPESLPVGFRRPTRDDLPFILSAWRNGARSLSDFAAVEKTKFDPWFDKRMERTLRASTTMVTLASDAEDSGTLHGFAIVNAERHCLMWWYVKRAFRRMGLGRRLLDEVLAGWHNPMRVAYAARIEHTHLGAVRLPRYLSGCIYDPSCWEP